LIFENLLIWFEKMVKLPKITKWQTIGKKGANIIASIFNEFCIVIPIPQESDLGIDLDCELIEKISDIISKPTGIHFNIQCKTKEEIKEDSDFIRVKIKVETINYWLIQARPTFLIVVDDTSKECYWTFPEEELKKRSKDRRNQNFVYFKVPKSNIFDYQIKEIPTKMKKIIDDYYIEEDIDDWLKSIEQLSRTQLEFAHSLKLLEIPILGTLERPEFNLIKQFIKEQNNIVITGEPGSGKSGLIINMSEELIKKNVSILCYRLSSLEKNDNIISLLEKYLGIETPLIKVIAKILEQNKQFFIILDQLDSVGGSPLSQSIVTMINLLRNLQGIKLLIVCRSFDLEYWDEIRNLNFIEFICKPINDELVRNFLIKMGITENFENLLELATNFLNLKIIAELKSLNIDLNSITGELSLWGKFCDTIKEREGREAFASALQIARETLLNGERDFYLEPIYKDNLTKLLSREVLIQLEGERLSFKHEQLQDFLYTWDCFNRNYNSDDVLKEINENIARKIIFWLVQLYHMKKPKMEIKLLESVFNE